MKNILAFIGLLLISFSTGYAQRPNTSKPPLLFGEATFPSPQLRAAISVTNSTASIVDSIRVKPWVDSVRVTRVTMDFRALLTQREIILNFFEGDSFTAQRTKVQPLSENVFSWQGTIASHRASINLIVRSESLRGELHLAEHVFRIETLPDKTLLLYRVSTMKLPPIQVD
jgi:hypothetical protein